jgi:hypothetical protein
MMFDPEARAVFLAQFQMESGSWRIPDKDEGDLPMTCHVCDVPIRACVVTLPSGRTTTRNPRPGTRVCPACIRLGWRSAACLRCGNVTRSWNWTSKKRSQALRGMCPTCRDEAHRDGGVMQSGGAARYAEVDS